MTVWRRYRLKDICTYIGSGTTPKSSNSKYYDNGTYYWINTGDLNNGVVSSSKQQISDFALKDYPTLRFYPKGTIIEAMYGATIGKVGMLGMDATVNQACCAMVIDRNKAIPNFVLYYLVYYKPQLIKESFGGTQPNVNQFKVSNIAICIPPLETQQKIITYLDTKLSEIDHQVSILTSKRDAYLRLKKSIINHVVTRGLNPNVKMKDSGVEWIGEVPGHWEVKRMKDICKLSPTIKPYEQYLYCSYLPMEGLRLDNLETSEELVSKLQGKYTPFENGDLLIAKVTPCFENGNIAIAKGLTNGFGFGSSEIFVIRQNKNSCTRFLFYMTLSTMFQDKACATMCGVGGLKRISPLFMKSHTIAIPPLHEQHAIATYLDDKCAKIDTIVSNLDKQISRYADLKRSLIDEVITGKRAV